jgi:MFS family permease
MTEHQQYERRWKTLGVLGLSLVLIGLDNTVLNVALPSIQRELAASASVLQWMVDAYLLVFAGLLLLAGALGDRYGRKRALQAGLGLFGVASVAAVFASDGDQVIAARALMGLGAAFVMPATLSIIIDVFPREERAKAIGAWAGMAAIGTGLGPAIGGALLEVAGWQSVFALNLPVVAAALVLGHRLVPDSRDPAPGRLDVAGAALSIAGLGALVYTIIEAPSHGWTSGTTLTGFAVAAVLGRPSPPASAGPPIRSSTCGCSAGPRSPSGRSPSPRRSSPSSGWSSPSRSSCSSSRAPRPWRPASSRCRSRSGSSSRRPSAPSWPRGSARAASSPAPWRSWPSRWPAWSRGRPRPGR